MAQYRKDLLALDPAMDNRLEMVMIGDRRGRIADFHPSFTSKNRLRVSDQQTRFFSTFQYDKAPSVWDEQTTGGGVATWDTNGRHVDMVVSDPGDEVIRQTRSVMEYIPSRSTQISFAFNFKNGDTGVRRRIGIFDDNNGAYFEDGEDGIHYVVIRSSVSGSVVETRVPQSQWNVDKLDGTGHSQTILDLTKVQMLVIDYEWYGAGHVEFSFLIDNERILVHDFEHANKVAEPWSATPFLPIRSEITQISATSGSYSLEQYSTSQVLEGSSKDTGISRSITTALAGKSLPLANTWYPLLSIRLKSNNLNGVVIPTVFAVASEDNSILHYRLTRNPTLTGASWVPHPVGESIIEYDLSATTISGGEPINSGFIAAGTNPGPIELNGNATYRIGRSGLGTVSDIWTLEVSSAGTNKIGHGTLNWVEQR